MILPHGARQDFFDWALLMARIPDAELERLKAEVSIERLVASAGVVLRRHGRDLLGLCPFHDDREPSRWWGRRRAAAPRQAAGSPRCGWRTRAGSAARPTLPRPLDDGALLTATS